MTTNDRTNFEVLHRLAVNSASGGNLAELAQQALEGAAVYLGLDAAALILWDGSYKVTLAASHSISEDAKSYLLAQEAELFKSLREKRGLVTARLSFAGPVPHHLFTLPLQYNEAVYGAVIGYQRGKEMSASVDSFLSTLVALLALHVAATNSENSSSVPELIEREKLAAVIQTAVTVNHEVNNPLTAILGNVQLLLLKRADLDDELRAKLKTIEESAMKIKEVTHRLLQLTAVRTKQYSEGTQMLDLTDDKESK